ncbi:hypothetical protein [Mycetocola saprophilus]|uniref:hypothetical protein n=1 Tax=Mycetocola saprophilus TaxID=76636 RepID=UPI0004C15C8A|nr:hypothetical protein [Mycetocola saprophilus]
MDLLKTMDPYSAVASWAIWETKPEGGVIDKLDFPVTVSSHQLNPRVMIVALNPARESEISPQDAASQNKWGNFHTARKHNDHFLARAFEGTPYWGAYMADLYPEIRESDSGKVRAADDVAKAGVRLLVEQAKLLGGVEVIICLGSKTYDTILKNLSELAELEGVTKDSLRRVTHYSGAAAAKHKNNPEVYRTLVHTELDIL